MVGLDLIIEQVAPLCNFWYWKNGIIPLQNYIAWFIISFLIALIVQKHLCSPKNKVAFSFYFIQLFFFLILWWIN
jgi:putative membrane protein